MLSDDIKLPNIIPFTYSLLDEETIYMLQKYSTDSTNPSRATYKMLKTICCGDSSNRSSE